MSSTDILMQILGKLNNIEDRQIKIEKVIKEIKLSKSKTSKSKSKTSTKTSTKTLTKKPSKASTKTSTKTSTYKKSLSLLTIYNNIILVHGNTFEYKDDIKTLGGFWYPQMKGWILKKDKKTEISKIIDNIIINTLEEDLEGEFTVKKSSPTTKKLDPNRYAFDSDSD